MQDSKKSEAYEHYITHCKPIEYFNNILNINEDDAYKYLRGEVINSNNVKDGWVLIAYKNLGLGWGKAKNGIIKNHYPKGLRNLN